MLDEGSLRRSVDGADAEPDAQALVTELAPALGIPPLRTVLGGGRGPALITALGGTGRLTLVTGVLLASGLALSG